MELIASNYQNNPSLILHFHNHHKFRWQISLARQETSYIDKTVIFLTFVLNKNRHQTILVHNPSGIKIIIKKKHKISSLSLARSCGPIISVVILPKRCCQMLPITKKEIIEKKKKSKVLCYTRKCRSLETKKRITKTDIFFPPHFPCFRPLLLPSVNTIVVEHPVAAATRSHTGSASGHHALSQTLALSLILFALLLAGNAL